MRISVENNDPGYTIYHTRIEVLLNGQVVKWCKTADEEEGFVINVKVGNDGRPLRDFIGQPIHERLHGTVVIRGMTPAIEARLQEMRKR